MELVPSQPLGEHPLGGPWPSGRDPEDGSAGAACQQGGSRRGQMCPFHRPSLEVWRSRDGLDGALVLPWARGTVCTEAWGQARQTPGEGSTNTACVTIGTLTDLCLDQTQRCCDQRLREGCGHQDLLLRLHCEHNEELPHLLLELGLHLRATRPGEASEGPATVTDGWCHCSRSPLCEANHSSPSPVDGELVPGSWVHVMGPLRRGIWAGTPRGFWQHRTALE